MYINISKKYFKILLYLIIILSVDFFLSNLFFKNKSFWEYKRLNDLYWRIPSNIYHHDLLPNINVIEPWGFSMSKRLITNSLGFRDFTNKQVKKVPTKKRLLLIGDSAIEGAGYDYEYTLGGMLQNHLNKKYEVLNSAVGSYSPSIYYKKISFFINEGYQFNKAIIFLDPSDIIDELFIKWDENNNIIVDNDDIKQIKFSDFLVNNFLIFRTFLRISDATENLKNFLKLKYKTSKKYKKSFFKTTNQDTLFYRMTHVDRSAWTFDNQIFKDYKEGLTKSEKYLDKLVKVLKENNVEIHFVLYPHPSQIYYKDLYHYPFWEKWAKKNNLDLTSLYSNFDGENKRKIILDTFIYGDLHWNKNGTKIVFESLINQIDF
jgi:hypothetical protein